MDGAVAPAHNISQATAPPLLATKTFIPALRSDTVRRPRLTERLQQSLNRRLTLISAPAGFGKTTLVSEWSATGTPEARRLAWVTLDEGDNDPGRFLSYLVSAIRTVEPCVGARVLSLVRTGLSRDPIALLTDFINEIETLSDRLVVVLDDYHVITSEQVHQAVAFLLERMPPTVHVIITSRVDPPLPLPRLRASRELVELRADTLRFTVEESTAFLNDVMGLDLAPEQVASIEARTEGWIAGLLLAALSAGNAGNRDSLLDSFAGDHRYVFDYLAEEVLRRQEPEIQHFLTRTAVLERMNGEVADVMTGGNAGQATLEWLVRSNLFTIPLDQTRIWYRYHHLFGEFLSSRFRQSDPDGWVAAHRQASDWYYQTGQLEDAVEHAIIAGDHPRLVSLIEEAGLSMVRNGQIATLSRWLDRAGDSTCQESPALCLLQAWAAMFDRRLNDAERWLQRIDADSLKTDQSPGSRTDYALCRATFARFRGDIDTIIQTSEWAIDQFRKSGAPDDAPHWSVVGLHLGSGYRQTGKTRQSIPILRESIERSWLHDNRVVRLNAMSELAAAYWNLGQFGQADEAAARALAFEDEAGLRPIAMTCTALLASADIHRERNELAIAATLAATALQMVELDLEPPAASAPSPGEALPPASNTEDARTQMAVYDVRARIALARGELGAAKATASEAIARSRRLSLSEQEMMTLDGLRARLDLAGGEVEAAADWARQYELSVEDPISFLTEPAYLTFARLLIDQGKHTEAGRLLERLRGVTEAAGRQLRLVETDLLRAVLLDATGRRDAALALIAATLRRSQQDRYLRVFTDTHPAIVGLLRTARLEQGYADCFEYLDEILGAATAASGGDPGHHAGAGIADPLSEREVEVLQLLASGKSNRDIAGQIYVTVGTIKRHTHNIYRKLGAHNRTQAIVRGRELGLIE